MDSGLDESGGRIDQAPSTLKHQVETSFAQRTRGP